MAPPLRCHEETNGSNNTKSNGVTTNNNLLLNAEEFRRQGNLVVDLIADYYAGIGDIPVHPTSVTPGFLLRQLPAEAPAARPGPEAFTDALRDIRDVILPGMTHWQSPRHMAHFPASSSTVGALGEALAAGINAVPFTWAASPAATELEMVVVDWLGAALRLPEPLLFRGGGGGTFVGTTCEAILCALVAARERKLAAVGGDRAGDLVVYCSDQTHFALAKAARIAGVRRLRALPTRRADAFALSPRAVRDAVRDDVAAGLVPLFLCATVGTTATGAVDPVGDLCAAVKKEEVWVHVDAAYAGSALVCPEFRQGVEMEEGVDSFSMNAHKWLLANTDCCAMWVRDPRHLTDALGTDHDVILKDAAAEGHHVVDYKDWTLTLTRRFRALKMWLVLRCYGVEGLRDHVRAHVSMAAMFETMVRADTRFEVVAERRFALVCFRLRPPPILLVPHSNGFSNGGGHHHHQEEQEEVMMANLLNRRLLEEINATTSGPYLSSATVAGVYMLRCAIGSTLTTERHVVEAWKVVQDRAAFLLRRQI
ncbi:hypothetical protein PR202_ga25115 [Eleusine coracana subsp. coracana]|uniref:Tyrosine decarboxylase n=1 Tax=Eleusine coracana subsp. coracana TaxID=191504 RepID=A0AAV5DA58_ELECO|nr:hypothetical protein QOZ80_9AG0670910 [Eleusine coracana subsp. coracana]GJN07295.1 hypothetical protein PR202_ga25115 [Eleusine coracana subsp. coracana]